jgi:hypothetical protein
LDTDTGVIHDFAVNNGKKNGPTSMIGSGGGLERPVAARFDLSVSAIYVVDFCRMDHEKHTVPYPGKGVLLRIIKNIVQTGEKR